MHDPDLLIVDAAEVEECGKVFDQGGVCDRFAGSGEKGVGLPFREPVVDACDEEMEVRGSDVICDRIRGKVRTLDRIFRIGLDSDTFLRLRRRLKNTDDRLDVGCRYDE